MPEISLYRTFTLRQEADPRVFNLHGRLYGGFWINLPKAQRDDLRIDGEQVADLDFAAMFPSLAYIRAGYAPPVGDPYAIEGLEGYRSGAKAAMSALLSSGPLRALPDRVRKELPEGWPIQRLRKAIIGLHPALAGSLEQDLSLEFMFVESRILMITLRALASQGILALPMHDGVMVAASRSEAARSAMEAASVAVVGQRIPVVLKG